LTVGRAAEACDVAPASPEWDSGEEALQRIEHHRIESLDTDVYVLQTNIVDARGEPTVPTVKFVYLVRGTSAARIYPVWEQGLAANYGEVEAFVTTIAERLPDPPQLPADSPKLPVSVVH
jgi:hypothetical protein